VGCKTSFLSGCAQLRLLQADGKKPWLPVGPDRGQKRISSAPGADREGCVMAGSQSSAVCIAHHGSGRAQGAARLAMGRPSAESEGLNAISTRALSLPPVCVRDSRGQFQLGSWLLSFLTYF